MIFKTNLEGIALLISEKKAVKKKGLVTAVTSLFYLDTARPPLTLCLPAIALCANVQLPAESQFSLVPVGDRLFLELSYLLVQTWTRYFTIWVASGVS